MKRRPRTTKRAWHWWWWPWGLIAMLIVLRLRSDLGYSVAERPGCDQALADLAALAAGEDLENQRYVDACGHDRLPQPQRPRHADHRCG